MTLHYCTTRLHY